MANFKLVSANQKQIWSTKYTTEYVRESGFMPYMDTSTNAIIPMDKQLSSQSGAIIHFPYFAKLSSAGVTGGTTLYGNEENLKNYSCAVKVTLRRNAVAVPESETYQTELDIANVARPSLVNWSAENLRNDLIVAMQSVVIPGAADSDGNPTEDTYVPYAAATTGQLNTWATNNADRVLYGNKRGNSTGTQSTSLANIDATQKLSAGVITMAKTLAKKSNPYKIRPYKSDMTAGREWYVLFVGPEGFRDLQVDPVIYAANKDARSRDVDTNPIFQSGDLVYNGVIIREIPEMTLTGTVGASSAQVGHAALAGINSVAVAYSKMPEPRTQVFDYGHMNNVGIMEIRGQAKFSVAGVQTGIVSIFHAAASDA